MIIKVYIMTNIKTSRVVVLKDDPYFWYLSITVLLLGFEGVFTLALKESQEWRFISPCIFLYLSRFGLHDLRKFIFLPLSVCPAIWLIELDRLEDRISIEQAKEMIFSFNYTTSPPTTTNGNLIFTCSRWIMKITRCHS